MLELADGVAAGFCAKVLADLGAEVIAVEPPEGHPLRRSLPRRADGFSARFAYLSTGKQRLVLDAGAEGVARLRDLAREADLLVTDRAPDEVAALTADAPGTAVVVIRPFGSTGPYSRDPAYHLTLFHAAGEGSLLPSGPGWKLFPDRAPIQLGSEIAYFDAGWNAAVAALALCYDLQRSGSAQHADVSIQESELTLNRTRLSRYANDGVVLGREGNRYGITGMLRCADGWVQLVGLREEQWDLLRARAAGTELDDERFATAAARAEHLDALGAALASWCAARPKREVTAILQELGAPVGMYATPPDLLASEQLAHRGFFQTVPDGRGGTITLPGAPYRMSRTPVVVRPPGDVTATATFGAHPRVPRGTDPGGGRLLEGVRVVDFTWAAAGPYATLLLALLGAEVVKVESTRRPDPARRGFLADYGGINRSPNFNELNLNKRSLQVDLTQPEGLRVVKHLIAQADVVVDNFRPGVMERLGLGAAALLAEHPGLVVASSSANGSTGPDAMAAGLASIFGATGGLSEQTGYRDGPPTEVGESTDYRSANALAVAILAALLHRARTGEGQHVDVASREAVIASAPDALLAHVIGVPWEPRIGNEHRELAPHDVYRCAGDDDWVAIAVGTEVEWAALCGVLGRAEWVAAYPSATDRRAAIDVIDAAIGAWARERPSSRAFAELRAAGVPASPVMTNRALVDDPHLAARGVFVDVEHPEIGKVRVMRAPWRLSHSDCGVKRHGPLLGADNDTLLRGIPWIAELGEERYAEVFR